MRRRQGARESAPARADYCDDEEHNLTAEREDGCAGEVGGEFVLGRGAALMIFVEGDEAVASGDEVERELQIICALDAVVGDDEGIAQDSDMPTPVHIVCEHCAALVHEIKDRRGR